MRGGGGGQQFQAMVPFTKAVKWLVIINVVVWVSLVLVLQQFVLGSNIVFEYFALVPYQVLTKFWVWQLFTYMFLHSTSVFHILFNMLVLWWCGSELEQRWGSRFFVTYYLVCGVGAGLIYFLGTTFYALISSGGSANMMAPLVGASGATYGLLLAYGILFGDRMIYFMMLFPMKARYFVMILGAVELFTMMDSGSGSQVANLAHLGGLVVGFLFLSFIARWRARRSSPTSKRGRRLKLVVDNERPAADQPEKGPRYWN